MVTLLRDWINTKATFTIKCDFCDKISTVGFKENIDCLAYAEVYFQKEGWESANNECYCPECVKL